MQFIKRFFKKERKDLGSRLSFVGLVIGIISLFIGIIAFLYTPTKQFMRGLMANLATKDDLSDLNSGVKFCDINSWQNKDNLEIINESKVIRLNNEKESGLAYFREAEVNSSLLVDATILPRFDTSSNIVFYFSDPLNENNFFQFIIGNGSSDLISLKFSTSGKELIIKDKRLMQPIAKDREFRIVIDIRTRMDGFRDVVLYITYYPDNNPNSDRLSEDFKYSYSISKGVSKINFEIGLINPYLIENSLLFQLKKCLFQEINIQI